MHQMMKKKHSIWTQVALAVFLLLMAACGDLDGLAEKDCPKNGEMDCPCLSSGMCNLLEDGTMLPCREGI